MRCTAFQIQQKMKIDQCTEESVTILSSGQYYCMCYAKLKHEKIRGWKMSVGMKIIKWKHTDKDVGGASSLFVQNVGVIMIIIINKMNTNAHVQICINILVSIVIFPLGNG